MTGRARALPSVALAPAGFMAEATRVWLGSCGSRVAYTTHSWADRLGALTSRVSTHSTRPAGADTRVQRGSAPAAPGSRPRSGAGRAWAGAGRPCLPGSPLCRGLVAPALGTRELP